MGMVSNTANASNEDHVTVTEGIPRSRRNSPMERPSISTAVADSYVGDSPTKRCLQRSVGDAPGVCLSPIMTVAEFLPPQSVRSPPYSLRHRPFALARTTYRSHSTQYSPHCSQPRTKGGGENATSIRSGPTISSNISAHVKPGHEHIERANDGDTVSSENQSWHTANRSLSSGKDDKFQPMAGQFQAQGPALQSFNAGHSVSNATHLEVEERQPVGKQSVKPDGREGEPESQLEARLRAFERKTAMLEAALLAVINASAGLGEGVQAGAPVT